MVMFLIRKKSSIHGFGIFTTRKIMAGDIFYKIPTDMIFDKPKDRCAFLNGIWIFDDTILNWVNHSCDPNTEIKNNTLVARRNISAGEEITCNYNYTEIGGSRVPCNCKNKACRKYFLRKE